MLKGFSKKNFSDLRNYSEYQVLSQKIFIRVLTIIGLPIFIIFGIQDLYQSQYFSAGIALIMFLTLCFLIFDLNRKPEVQRSYSSQKIIIRFLLIIFIFYFLYVIGFEKSLSKAPWFLIFPVLIFSIANNKETLVWIFCIAAILVPLLFHANLDSSPDEIFRLKVRLLIIFGVLTSVTFITTAIIRSVIGNLIDSKKEIHNTNLRLNNEIKERNKAEEQIQASEKKFREIIEDVSGISIQGYDEQRKVIFWNQASEKLYGYTEQEALGKKIDDLIVPSGMREQIQGLIQKWIEYGEKIPAKEVELIDKNGNIVPVFSSHVMHETPQGKERFCIDIDLTELKLAQEEKIKAQQIAGEHEKLALVGQIAGKMAHDFNNILGIIMGNTELSLLDCKDAETRKTLELIFEQTLRGKNLTRNLVAFAKDQEPRREFFRIYDKIDLVLSLLKIDLKEIELIKEDKPGVPDLLADPGMIEHALVNLVQNSIHALSMVDQPRIIIRTYCLRNNICLEIEDNGCGIPKEHLEKIYEPSFTLKGSCDVTGSYKTGIKGTGYGMSNIKKYIKQHKGSIFVESVFGSGTKFTINLPVIKKELTNEEKTQIQKKITHFEKYILLVEDETAISDIQYRILTQEPCNHKVDIAQNGQIAMDLFKRNEYDVVSLDYVLPGKINGMDVYHHIRKADKTLPILFVSGNINFLESIKELKQKDPYIDHQSKPCQNKNYVYSINRLLKRKLTIS